MAASPSTWDPRLHLAFSSPISVGEAYVLRVKNSKKKKSSIPHNRREEESKVKALPDDFCLTVNGRKLIILSSGLSGRLGNVFI